MRNLVIFLLLLLLLLSAIAFGADVQAATLIEPGQPNTITVQAAAPNVTVQAAQAPNVTVQAAQAPNVTVQASKAPDVHVDGAQVHVDAPDLSQIKPANVNVEAQKTDWNALLAAMGGAAGTIWGGICIVGQFISSHHKKGNARAEWQDLLAWAYQYAEGGGLTRLEKALELARTRFRESSGGDMSAEQERNAEHALAAIHLQAVGPLEHDAADEINKEETELKSKLAALAAKKASLGAAVMLVLGLIFFPGCEASLHADKLNADIAKSAAGVKVAYANVVDTFISYYVSNENARIDELHAAAVASHDAPTAAKIAAITKSIQVGNGTVTTADPGAVAAILDGKAKIIAILEKQRQANYAQVQRVAAAMHARLMAAAVDAEHIIALTEGLKQYFATRTNTETTINASAAEVLQLATQFIPAAAPAKK